MLAWAEKSIQGDAERARPPPFALGDGQGDRGGSNTAWALPHILLGCHPRCPADVQRSGSLRKA